MAQLDTSIIIAAITTAITIIVLTTRLLTGHGILQSAETERGSEPPMLPYWIPFIGHLLAFLHDPEALLKQAREVSPAGIFALRMGRYKHNVVYLPMLLKSVLSREKSQASIASLRLAVMKNVFGLEARDEELYRSIESELDAAVLPHLQASKDSQETFPGVLKHLLGNLPDLVTLNGSVVDQEPWERLSLITVSSDNNVAEASLLPLVQIFLTHMTVDTIFTSSILSDSDHVEVAPLLMALTQSFGLLMTGLPRTVPHPYLPSAHMARKKLLDHLDALSKDVLEDSDMQSPMLAARQAVLDKHDISLSLRSADLLALMWNTTAPHLLAFWFLLHLVSDQMLLSHVRKESSNFVKVVQDPPVMGFAVPPRLTIDIEGLMNSCPLLKCAYIETVRIYSRGLYTGTAQEDFTIETKEKKLFQKVEKWAVKKDEFVDIPYWLSNTDPATFPNPEAFDADRHLETDENGKDVAGWGDVTPQYGIFGLDEARDLAERTCLAFVAGAIALWDFEPTGSKGWRIPQATFAAGVALPKGDIRVRIKRYELVRK